jgi:3-isopropylmalate/(R)-2-methylmalate dehydratase small subunit
MQPLKQHQGIVAPLDRANVDTDQIIPKQFLKRIERSGFGQFLFYDWRFDHQGKENPQFVLNQAPYRAASILLTQDNFGCGSSREHAPWALLDFGFRVIIAPSFADIFYNNCFKNGILPIKLPKDQVDHLFQLTQKHANYQLTIDLEQQRIVDAYGLSLSFDVDEYRRTCLLEGLDDISITLKSESAISNYEAKLPAYYSINKK